MRSGIPSKGLEVPSNCICLVTCLLRTNHNEQGVKYADLSHMLYPWDQVPESQMDLQLK